MNTRILWSRILNVVGFIAMLIGAIDPLEGAFIILPGSSLVALSAFLCRDRYRKLLYWAFTLIAFGVGIMFVVSVLGGIGGSSGRSMWWGLFILPYPVGWIVGITAGIFSFIESSKNRARLKRDSQL